MGEALDHVLQGNFSGSHVCQIKVENVRTKGPYEIQGKVREAIWRGGEV